MSVGVGPLVAGTAVAGTPVPVLPTVARPALLPVLPPESVVVVPLVEVGAVSVLVTSVGVVVAVRFPVLLVVADGVSLGLVVPATVRVRRTSEVAVGVPLSVPVAWLGPPPGPSGV